ncbi:YadA-like family protein [Altererythrobacter lutimaris]|uniref:YadA-like family protein n=1 Tax=Altererythrobacter lutimaris TaxID=2743979 RepID=A0A850HBR4_9SPHN|nr:YadA-like family protein [Altererythrobacter lutimaris]NVE94451.1 YadA-like family protein [Altererythrobacter lutimaris]
MKKLEIKSHNPLSKKSAEILAAMALAAALASTTIPGVARAGECVLEDEAASRSTAGATTSGTDTLACGEGAIATGDWAQAVGNNSEASGVDSLAVGNSALATDRWALAIGNLSAALAERSTAIGTGADAEGTDSMAVGWNAFASAPAAIAMGSAAEATGEGAIAIGTGSFASGQNSIAIGNGATATAAGQVVVASLDSSTLAQSGPIQVVTADAQGTLGLMPVASSAQMSSAQSSIKSLQFMSASHTAQIDELFSETAENRSAIRRANEGVALALSMESPALPSGTSFALSGGIGYFDNAAAGSMAMTARVSDRAAISAGVGVGFDSGEVGARGGFQVAW